LFCLSFGDILTRNHTATTNFSTDAGDIYHKLTSLFSHNFSTMISPSSTHIPCQIPLITIPSQSHHSSLFYLCPFNITFQHLAVIAPHLF
jgi:hypothetical protein